MDPADQHQTIRLSSNDAGEIRMCPDCGDLELSFGNVVIGLERSDISLFLHRVIELQEAWPSRSSAVLYLNDTGLGVSFDRDQLRGVRELLESVQAYGASAVLEAICGPLSVSDSLVH